MNRKISTLIGVIVLFILTVVEKAIRQFLSPK